MRMQKPYEEGPILLDPPQHDTMDEPVELARDKGEWQGTANAIYPARRLAAAVLATVLERWEPREGGLTDDAFYSWSRGVHSPLILGR